VDADGIELQGQIKSVNLKELKSKTEYKVKLDRGAGGDTSHTLEIIGDSEQRIASHTEYRMIMDGNEGTLVKQRMQHSCDTITVLQLDEVRRVPRLSGMSMY
jgi:hypothetical protein